MIDSLRLSYFHVFVVTGGLIAAAVTVPGCSTENLHPRTATAGSPPPISGSFSLCINAPGGVRSLDLFIYRDTLTRPLENHIRLLAPVPDILELDSRPGDRLLVAIANSPAAFREEALQRYESAELLEMYYREENPDFPLMSAVCAFSEGPLLLQLSPLLCRVNIYSINNLSDLALSGARVRLRGANSHVPMLRQDGFRTVETEDNPAALAFPGMMECGIPGVIGRELLTPWLRLSCYPFDSEGPAATTILFTAIADGESREWSFPLPPLERGRPAEMALAIK